MKQVTRAAERFAQMKVHFTEQEKIIAFAVRDGYAKNESEARKNIDGVLQWLAGHAVDRHESFPYVMMNGGVDQMYHALILNSRTYLHFCRDYVGFFVHHTPLMDTEINSVEIMRGVAETIDYLEKSFGEALSPSLHQWSIENKIGQLNASSVSCVGNAPDTAPQNLLGIADFATFFDRNAHQTVGNA